MFKWTKEHQAAADRWVTELKCPLSAHPSVLRKFKRLRLTPEQIITDLEVKLARLRGEI